MPITLDEGRFPVIIDKPFTLRELAGPWSWMAIRYYWLVYDELMAPLYLDLARQGHDPAELVVKPALSQLAGNVELVLEQTSVALRIVDAGHGSVILWASGAWKALNSLAAWLPIYGKWLQEKGQIDIRTEIERSDALLHLMGNFVAAGIPEVLARKMALERLYGAWPDFYAGSARHIEEAVNVGEPERTGNALVVSDATVRALLPPPISLPPGTTHRLENREDA
jgi:hypothetical protein